MPLYAISSFDVWGNAAEGFEVNNTFRGGNIFIPQWASDREVVEALVKAGELNDKALEAFDENELAVGESGDNGIEIGELEVEIAVTDRHGENRWLDYNGTVEEAKKQARGEALREGDNRRDGLLNEWESPDDIEEVSDFRPLLGLESNYEPPTVDEFLAEGFEQIFESEGVVGLVDADNTVMVVLSEGEADEFPFQGPKTLTAMIASPEFKDLDFATREILKDMAIELES